MKKVILIIGLLTCAVSMYAQQPNKDSLSLVSKISSDEAKLARLESQVAEKTKDKNDAADRAQQSAKENAEAAKRLDRDPQDKKRARKSDNAASDARSDAKKARIAANNLDKLNNDIARLRDKITKEKSRLEKYTTARL
jgi:cell division protein FtsL